MKSGFEIRHRTGPGDAFEVWKWVRNPENTPWYRAWRTDWTLLGEHVTIEGAVRIMKEHVPVHYDTIDRYDANGRIILDSYL